MKCFFIDTVKRVTLKELKDIGTFNKAFADAMDAAVPESVEKWYTKLEKLMLKQAAPKKK